MSVPMKVLLSGSAKQNICGSLGIFIAYLCLDKPETTIQVKLNLGLLETAQP